MNVFCFIFNPLGGEFKKKYKFVYYGAAEIAEFRYIIKINVKFLGYKKIQSNLHI